MISANSFAGFAYGTCNSLPSYTTYSGYKNDWTGNTTGIPASANVLLNQFYLNPNGVSTYGECINWTYLSYNDLYKSKNCTNIKGYGIQSDNLRNYIEDVTWYLKGPTSNENTKQAFYACERSDGENVTNCYPGGTTGRYYDTKTETKTKIGLMYVSDYLYASGYVASSDTTTQATSNYYGNSNWLHSGLEWTITPLGNSNDSVFYVRSVGSLKTVESIRAYGIRPTFYLKEQVYVTGGNGSFHNPYTIACDNCNS